MNLCVCFKALNSEVARAAIKDGASTSLAVHKATHPDENDGVPNCGQCLPLIEGMCTRFNDTGTAPEPFQLTREERRAAVLTLAEQVKNSHPDAVPPAYFMPTLCAAGRMK